MQGHASGIRSIALNSTGEIIVSGSSDCTIRFLDIKTGKCLNILQAFSVDGLILATASEDFTVKLWDVSTGECLRTLRGHAAWVFSVALSCDGATVISGSGDETIKIWNIETGKCLKTLKIDRPYERMNITGVKGLTKGEIATLKALGAVEDREI